MSAHPSSVALTDEEKLDLASRVFKEWFARCFWSWDPHVIISKDNLPQLIRDLRLNGGHEGYRIAARLCR